MKHEMSHYTNFLSLQDIRTSDTLIIFFLANRGEAVNESDNYIDHINGILFL